jgi:hypothetical protein
LPTAASSPKTGSDTALQEPNSSASEAAPPCNAGKEASLNADGSLQKSSRLVDLEKLHDASPGDKEVAAALADELFQTAQYFMYCSPERPNRKYPAAYCLYGQVLSVEPDHEQARDARKIIADIYESLGKGVPTCSE